MYYIQRAITVNVFVKLYKHFHIASRFVFEQIMLLLFVWEIESNLDRVLARWNSNLETCDYDLIYRKCALHGNADSLSRMPNPYCKRTDCPDGICAKCWPLVADVFIISSIIHTWRRIAEFCLSLPRIFCLLPDP